MLQTVLGEAVSLEPTDGFVHLQFRRFAGCPICNLHLRTIVERHDEIVAAGVREVVVFHSPVDELREYAADVPFALVADPDKTLYREWGVEAGRRALLDPRVWPVIVRAVVAGIRRRDRSPALAQPGGRLGLPADFLIAPGGAVVASKRGTHAYDQWSVDEILDHAST
ncbi:peroxiredoxin-like family protein [Cryptosporangium sp. NPDC048952]|uniref:peroxiredoxin-like family protein n=1 Tax=Cryptosporangium sp. NPDC048952 TaxID=3363961 RepID=UPI003717B39F